LWFGLGWVVGLLYVVRFPAGVAVWAGNGTADATRWVRTGYTYWASPLSTY
jgi:hypothetical protein